MSYTIKKLRINKDNCIKTDWESLLVNADIRPERSIDYTAGIYEGEESLSQSTAIYNKALKDVFSNEIELIVIPRKEFSSEVISASKVRKLFKENLMDQIKNIVPQSTYEFLISAEGKKIQSKIQEKEV